MNVFYVDWISKINCTFKDRINMMTTFTFFVYSKDYGGEGGKSADPKIIASEVNCFVRTQHYCNIQYEE